MNRAANIDQTLMSSERVEATCKRIGLEAKVLREKCLGKHDRLNPCQTLSSDWKRNRPRYGNMQAASSVNFGADSA